MPYRHQARVPRDPYLDELTAAMQRSVDMQQHNLAELAKTWRRLSMLFRVLAVLFAIQAVLWLTRLL